MAGSSLGGNAIRRMSIGATPIKRVSLGSVLVWSNAADPAGINKNAQQQALDVNGGWIAITGYVARSGFPLTSVATGGFVASSDGTLSVTAQITWGSGGNLGTHRTGVGVNGANLVLTGDVTDQAVSTVSGTIEVRAGDVVGLVGMFTNGSFGANTVQAGAGTYLAATPI
ncbi:hypothetical protein OG203_25620 [Nocardia sp. NBC_01499]|uniref:hypothetical protein n=1 Tax=Nocardia sp. NBC_01499 TaxID=2903597 RepID=UPI00386B9F0C